MPGTGSWRVVMFTPGLQLGGAELWVRTMITEMDSARIKWQAVVLAHSHTLINEKLLRPIAARTRVTAPYATHGQPEFAGLIERFPTRRDAAAAALAGADIVVCWAIGGVLEELLQDFKGPVVAVSHGVCRWTKADMLRQMEGGATHTVAVGARAASVCPNPATTKVIFNGVNPLRCEPKRSRETMRAEWGYGQDETIIVGYVGRFGVEKNPTAAAVAVANLPARYRAVLVGEAANSTLEAETHRLVAAIAGPRAKVCPATEEVGDVYGAIDVLVMASPAEGCSLTVIEAWLAGVPLVSTPVGIIGDLESRFGQIVFPIPIDPTSEELARAVREAAHAGRSSEVVQRARRIAYEHLTAKRMTDNWADFLEGVGKEHYAINGHHKTPQVSIVVPAWNEAERIEKSLRSILAQSYQDFELIVVNDGSTDNTAEIALQVLAGRPQTRVISKLNGGTGSALNLGFERAQGKYLTWWSADCWVYPEWLEQLKDCLDHHPEIVMAYGDWESFDQTSGITQTQHVAEFDKALLLNECYIGPCWLFRRTAKELAGRYLEEPCEDYDMHLKLAEIGPFRHVPHVLGVWRNHPLNLTTRLSKDPKLAHWSSQAQRIRTLHRQRLAQHN
ncbi:MAG: glycosyltransferase [Planctomycetota bacterium]